MSKVLPLRVTLDPISEQLRRKGSEQNVTKFISLCKNATKTEVQPFTLFEKLPTVELQWFEHRCLVCHGRFKLVLVSLWEIPQQQIWDYLE